MFSSIVRHTISLLIEMSANKDFFLFVSHSPVSGITCRMQSFVPPVSTRVSCNISPHLDGVKTENV